MKVNKQEKRDLYFGYYFSPLGPIEIVFSDEALYGLTFVNRLKDMALFSHPFLFEVQRQLMEYFSGQRKKFELPLIYEGTQFQLAVWSTLLGIPYGETVTYKDVALSLGRSRGFRAIGAANRANPISIIIPCHRVIGTDGCLVGYGGGIWRKRWLLAHEKKHLTFLSQIKKPV
ncbi:MAG: methylated-DNA--[protein]-cysteine S-methyltransferase [Candidatus Aminicenantes bacterium]|nr:methylated-DNA--[protein]-cysteine S-methyltransferase [Candidatus Aminicenantes bacterium]